METCSGVIMILRIKALNSGVSSSEPLPALIDADMANSKRSGRHD